MMASRWHRTHEPETAEAKLMAKTAEPSTATHVSKQTRANNRKASQNEFENQEQFKHGK